MEEANFIMPGRLTNDRCIGQNYRTVSCLATMIRIRDGSKVDPYFQ